MTSPRQPAQAKEAAKGRTARFALQYPSNWDDLSDEEQMSVARGMAAQMQKVYRESKQPK